MANQNEIRKEWKKPTVKTIANVRKTRGGPNPGGTIEDVVYNPS